MPEQAQKDAERPARMDAGKRFEEHVFPAELEEIARRRERLGVPRLPSMPADARPSAGLGLVGLAFSGGGIRSASFCLGVLQRLAHVRALPLVDYLSTVSGGGYVGTCVSALLGNPEDGTNPRTLPFPLRKKHGEEEPPALVHLRNGSNYLTPPGLLQKVRVPAILLRGVVLSMVSLMPYLIAAVFVTHALYTWVFPRFEGQGADLDYLRTSAPFSACVMLFTILAASYPFVTGFFRRQFVWHRRDVYERTIAAGLLVVIGALVAWPLATLIHYAVVSSPDQAQRHITSKAKHLADHYGVACVVTILGLVVASRQSRALAGLLRSAGAAMLAALGVMLPLGIYLLLCLYEISPELKVRDEDHTIHAALDAGSVPDALRPWLAELASSKHKHRPAENESAHLMDPGVPGVWKVDMQSGEYMAYAVSEGVVVRSMEEPDPGSRIILCVGLVLLLLNWRFLDVNMTSPHTFFRDRLSRVFLIRAEKGRVVPSDDLKLSDLNEKENAAAPYHLVNASLNLGGSKDPDLRGRSADFFFFSKRWVGSERTGYADTRTMESADPHMNLGTAMAISAAAASPQMGALASTREFSLLLAIANVRLSYWLPNPARADHLAAPSRLRGGPGPKYLLYEALGLPDEKRRFVNVSDGGHVENLGIYQLLRRHCKVIVAVDGEADPGLDFGGLVTLMRYALIDMGIRIDLVLDPLRKGEGGKSREQHAIGTIHYGEGERGTLVYLKACVRGDEGEVIRDYRRERPEFPHESTADQFFTEEQLEAYRALGEHIAAAVWPHPVTSSDGIGEALLPPPEVTT